MHNTNTRYLASAFVEANSLKLNNQDVTSMMSTLGTMLGDIQLLPNVVNEETPSGSVPRYVLIGITGVWQWQILLLGSRFDVSRVSANPFQGSNLGDYSTFCQQAGEILISLLERFQLRPHRLAAVQEGYLEEMSAEEITDVARRLMRFTDTYAHQILTEWDWRAVAQINREFGGMTEPTNTITTIKKIPGLSIQAVQGLPATLPINRIRADIDINTLPDNAAPRFDKEHIRSFFTEAVTWHRQLSSEFRSQILDA